MRIRDPGWKKFGSGIHIPDPQHCQKESSLLKYFIWHVPVSRVFLPVNCILGNAVLLIRTAQCKSVIRIQVRSLGPCSELTVRLTFKMLSNSLGSLIRLEHLFLFYKKNLFIRRIFRLALFLCCNLDLVIRYRTDSH
jgi:hypothetical protein